MARASMAATSAFRPERTLLLIKPDAVDRGLVGVILERVERAGLTLVGLKMAHVSEDLARRHYPDDERQLRQMGDKLRGAAEELGVSLNETLGTDDILELGRMIFERNVRFLLSGPVVAVVVEGHNAVRKTRSLCGATLPSGAIPGTIRGDFGSAGIEQVIWGDSTVQNLVHSSDGLEAANREIAHWFESK